jgi:hypothetical protein
VEPAGPPEEHPGTTTSHYQANGTSTEPMAVTGPIRGGGDRARGWLRSAMCSLAVLAAAAAAVSWDAQYVMVRQVKPTPAIAALEAAIPT